METKKRGRGLGKKPRLLCTSIRLQQDVMEYFNKHYPRTKQAKMREVLAEFVANQTKEQKYGTQETVHE